VGGRGGRGQQDRERAREEAVGWSDDRASRRECSKMKEARWRERGGYREEAGGVRWTREREETTKETAAGDSRQRHSDSDGRTVAVPCPPSDSDVDIGGYRLVSSIP